VDRKLLLTIQAATQALAVDIRHDVEQRSPDLPAVEEREQIRVLEICGDLDLAQEPLDAEDGAELRVEYLERDLAVVPQVPREIHGGHATGADLTLHGVAIGEPGGELREGVQRNHPGEGSGDSTDRLLSRTDGRPERSGSSVPGAETGAGAEHGCRERRKRG